MPSEYLVVACRQLMGECEQHLFICHGKCFGFHHKRARASYGSGIQEGTLQLHQESPAKK